MGDSADTVILITCIIILVLTTAVYPVFRDVLTDPDQSLSLGDANTLKSSSQSTASNSGNWWDLVTGAISFVGNFLSSIIQLTFLTITGDNIGFTIMGFFYNFLEITIIIVGIRLIRGA